MSASARTKDLVHAAGHGHPGLARASANARLLADLVKGAKLPIDMRPYRVDRF